MTEPETTDARAHGDRRGALRHSPLARDTAALVLNVGINGALGFAFWVAAARLYDTGVVGAAAASISAMVLVSGLGWLGWQFVVLRYLPDAGSTGLRLIAACYASAVAIAVGAAIIVALITGDTGETVTGIPFVLPAMAVVWVIFSLQDPVLIALGRASVVPIENAVFGAMKLVGVVALAAVGTESAIVVAWVASAALLVVVVNVAIIRPAARSVVGTPRLPPYPAIARFGVAQHLAAVLTAIPDSVVPLIVIALLGDIANAHYYAAWTVAFSLRLVTVNLANVYTVRAVADGAGGRAGTDLRRIAPLLIGSLVVVGFFGAGPILMVFGPGYEAGVEALRWMSIGIIPFSYATLAVARGRVRQRSGPAILVGVVATGVTLAVDIALLPTVGLPAAGLAWTLGWTAAAVAIAIAGARRRRDAMVLPVTTEASEH